MKTDDLVNLLVEDAATGWRLRSALLAALAVGVPVAMVLLAIIGPRDDFQAALATMRFDGKLVLAAGFAGLALRALFHAGRPEAASRNAFGVGVIGVIPAILIAAVVVELLVTPAASWGPRLVGHNALYCLSLIPLFALGPLAGFILALRRGAPARADHAGAIAGLAAAGIAAALYATHCTDDSPLFVATWYPLATAIVVFAGRAAGRRWLTW